ncbi:MAG: alpha/beta hydrolase [Betaproteobacteria bacterium]|nr:alpha/beta hydrolase [Betaproteobacteria bacterium]
MMSVEAWHEGGRLVRIQGRRIFVRDSGGERQAPVLVLIHGFPTASWDWAPVWEDLARRFRLVAMDLLGFGFSDKPAAHDYTIAGQADLVEAVLADAGVGQHHVLAHDYGDTVAQELLARDNARPAPRILSVTLLNGGLFPETHRARLIQRLLLTPAGPLICRLFNRRAFERSMRAIFGPETPPGREELEGFWRLICEQDGQRIMHRLIRYIPERRDHRERWVGALQQARCPLALINGSADPISGAHMVARWREVVGRGTVVELPGIGHYPQVEAPQQVLAHFHAFQAGIGA